MASGFMVFFLQGGADTKHKIISTIYLVNTKGYLGDIFRILTTITKLYILIFNKNIFFNLVLANWFGWTWKDGAIVGHTIHIERHVKLHIFNKKVGQNLI